MGRSQGLSCAPARKARTGFYDEKDPDESFTVRRVQRVYMLADTQGHPLQHSEIYDSLGIDPPSEIRAILQSGKPAIRVRKDPSDVPYMIRSGLWVDHDGHKYYLAIGRALDYNDKVISDFTWNYFAWVPLVIVLSGLLGWFLAGRALDPVNSVADAAQHITHSNLDVQIPARDAGDELDRLIEAFNHMMTRLNHSFEQIRQFSTDVSHELRTPLTVVRGQLEVALFTAADRGSISRSHGRRAGRRGTALQYRAGAADAFASRIRATGAAKDGDRSGRPGARLGGPASDSRRSGGRPAVGGAAGELSMSADRIQIERLLSNLLGNAIKYTPAGGMVKVSLIPGFDQVKLIVEDTGVGISPEPFAAHFRPFLSRAVG